MDAVLSEGRNYLEKPHLKTFTHAVSPFAQTDEFCHLGSL